MSSTKLAANWTPGLESELRLLANALGAAICCLDSGGRITFWNLRIGRVHFRQPGIFDLKYS